MSYRSFKHTLGETNIEWKCIWMFGVCLLLLIFSSFLLFGRVTENLVYEQSRRTSHSLIRTDLYESHWKKMENKGAPLLKSVRDALDAQIPKIAGSDDDLARILDGLSASIGREIVASGVENLTNQDFSNRSIRETLRPMEYSAEYIEPDAQLSDPWERRAMAECPPKKNGDSLYYWWRKRKEPNVKLKFEYYTPIYADASCVNCHRIMPLSPSGVDPRTRPQQLNAGDLLCMAKVAISDADIQSGLRDNRAILITTAFVTVVTAMLGLYMIVRYIIVKPLKHLRDVSDKISHGNIELRADIHTGDEFEELAVAFNRMLGHLTATQQELRNANCNLDAKVDELAQVNVQLYEMNRMRSDFLATMSHELRTPLNSIIGFSEVLAGISSLTDKQRRYCDNIQKSGKILLDHINDILDLAKMESGKMEVRLAEFSIEPVVHSQCDLVRPLAEKKNIDIDCRVQPSLPSLRQDQAKIQQILSNLLSNAIKFTPEGGSIMVKVARSSEQELVMVVSDTGIGIADEDQQVIFEKFRQGRVVTPDGDAMTREYSGTGLGLSIVKELCRLLGGGISLQSELGKGSSFTVRLPWIRSEQPRLESSMRDELEELSRKARAESLFRREVELSSGTSTG